MRKYSLLLIIALLYGSLFGQSITDRELNELATKLVDKVNNELNNQNIAIADFVDINDEPSDLGRYIAEELSFNLVDRTTKFKVIDRTHFRRLMKEAGLGDKGMVDPASVQKLGRLEGITAILYGKLIPTSNTIKVYVKVVHLEGQVNEATVRGTITRTPTIDDFLGSGGSKQKEEARSQQRTTHRSSPSFVNENIEVKVLQCTRRGTTVDCEIEFLSNARNDNLVLRTSQSRLVDANWNSYPASQVIMNGMQSSQQVSQPLAVNQPKRGIVSFSNIPASLSTAQLLEVNCTSLAAFTFTAQFEHIILKQ